MDLEQQLAEQIARFEREAPAGRASLYRRKRLAPEAILAALDGLRRNATTAD